MATETSDESSRFDPSRFSDSECEPCVGALPPGADLVRRTNGACVSRPGSDGVGSRAFDRHAKAPPAWEVLENGRGTLEQLFRCWSMPALGQAKLLEVLDSDPVTHVRATPRSVAVRVPSPKMGRVIQAASRTVEYAFVHYCEYDPDVLLYVDQPLTVTIRIVDALNRSRSVPYTCDYLVVRPDGVRVYECKPLEWLQKQSQKPNSRYVYDTSADAWRHPAAEEAFPPLRVRPPRVPLRRRQLALVEECPLPRGLPLSRSARRRRRGAHRVAARQVPLLLRRLPSPRHFARGVVLADRVGRGRLRPRT